MKVYVKGEKIVTTFRHPFYVINKGWVNAEALCEGDLVLLYDQEYAEVQKVESEH